MSSTQASQLTCVLCGVVYNAPAHVLGYQGLCPDHWNKDTLREWDRIESARRRLPPGTPATLTLAEWLSIIASWRGLCALCELNQFGLLALWVSVDGLTVHNAVPLCRACAYHKEHSFVAAMQRVSEQIAGTIARAGA